MARATVTKRFELSEASASYLETRARSQGVSQTALVEWLILEDAQRVEVEGNLPPRKAQGTATAHGFARLPLERERVQSIPKPGTKK